MTDTCSACDEYQENGIAPFCPMHEDVYGHEDPDEMVEINALNRMEEDMEDIDLDDGRDLEFALTSEDLERYEDAYREEYENL